MCEDNSVHENKPFYFANIKGLESCAFLTSSNKKGETEIISKIHRNLLCLLLLSLELFCTLKTVMAENFRFRTFFDSVAFFSNGF